MLCKNSEGLVRQLQTQVIQYLINAKPDSSDYARVICVIYLSDMGMSRICICLNEDCFGDWTKPTQ